MTNTFEFLDIYGLKSLYKRGLHAEKVLSRTTKIKIFLYKLSCWRKSIVSSIKNKKFAYLRSNDHRYVNVLTSNLLYFTSAGASDSTILDSICYFGVIMMRHCDKSQNIDSDLELLFSLVEFKNKFFFDPTLIKND